MIVAEPKARSPLFNPDGPLDVLPSAVENGFYVECEITNPPSMKGRKVLLRVPPDKADRMLLELREYGIRRRI